MASMVSSLPRKFSPKKVALPYSPPSRCMSVRLRIAKRDVYLRLKENGIDTILGCHVPQLLRYDDGLWVVDMSVVTRPFVLDFAGAFLDKAPDFSDEVLADWR